MWIASWITWEPISKWYLFLLISVDEDYAYDSQLHIYVTARISGEAYVSLRLRVQNGISRLISALCVNCLISIPRTMRKLSDLYSGIFQTQSSGCASGVDLFRNFTKLKILNIWIVKYLLNCKRYLSYNFRIFQKISECWVLERTTSGLCILEFSTCFFTDLQNILKFQHAFLQFSEHAENFNMLFYMFSTHFKHKNSPMVWTIVL